MAIARIATGNQNGSDLPIVLLQGWASENAQDRTTNGMNHSVVSIVVERTIDGSPIYADVYGWNSQYFPVLAVRKADSIFVIGSLKANEKNGKRHYDVDAYFIAASGAGLGIISLRARLDESEALREDAKVDATEEADEPDESLEDECSDEDDPDLRSREHEREPSDDTDRDHTVEIELRPDLNGDRAPIDPSIPVNDRDMPSGYSDSALQRRRATILDRLSFGRMKEDINDRNQRLREHERELSRDMDRDDMDRDYGPTR